MADCNTVPADLQSATQAASPADTPSPLLCRIMTLDGMIRRNEVGGVRNRLIQPILRRLKLLKRMVDRIGVDESRGVLVEMLLRGAEGSCMACKRAGRCRRWLDSSAADTGYHKFCPNAALFDVLPRKRSGTEPGA